MLVMTILLIALGVFVLYRVVAAGARSRARNHAFQGGEAGSGFDGGGYDGGGGHGSSCDAGSFGGDCGGGGDGGGGH